MRVGISLQGNYFGQAFKHEDCFYKTWEERLLLLVREILLAWSFSFSVLGINLGEKG